MTAAPTLFRARSVITMEPNAEPASAVLVDGDRIVAVGDFDDLRQRDCVVGDTFKDAVVCAGFIDQHLHPVLGQNPYTVACEQLNKIEVLGSVYAGRWFPAPG